jgi:hypothetical protein
LRDRPSRSLIHPSAGRFPGWSFTGIYWKKIAEYPQYEIIWHDAGFDYEVMGDGLENFIDQGPEFCVYQDILFLGGLLAMEERLPHFAMVRQELINETNVDRFPGTW